jgi:hypothetical protein
MDEVSVHPETLAGDPFAAKQHCCNDGWVSVGVETEEGETEEVLYLCRRCEEEGS